MDEQRTVYLLHFERRISKRHTCQHYMGSTDDLEKRLALHRRGLGSNLTRVAKQRGIGFELARTWAGDRKMERKLKNRHGGPRLCPICKALQNKGGE